MNLRIATGIGALSLFLIFALVLHQRTDWLHKKELKTNIDIPAAVDIKEQPALNHLACIMDGNRRWAKKRGLKPWEGHKAGIEGVRKTVEFCIKKGIKYLSLYTLSPENFNRPAQEISYLFDLMMEEAQKGAEEFKKNGIRLRFIGDRTLFPKQLVPLLDQFEKETAACDTLHLNFLFCYGGRQEIVAAAKAIAHEVKIGTIKEEDITPELVHNHLWTAEIPEPDLIIRTGYVSRLSNFLLYQAAYSELYMLDCYWPDITQEDLQESYDTFVQAKRTFGA